MLQVRRFWLMAACSLICNEIMMKIVDPHIHILDLWTRLYPGFEKPSVSFIGSTAPIARSYLIEELLSEGDDQFEIVKLVCIEAMPTDRLAETRSIQAVADRTGFPQGIVCGADLSLDGAQAELEQQIDIPNVRGIRHVLNVHSDPLYNYMNEEFLDNAVWRRNFGLLNRFDLSFDMQLYPHQFDKALGLVREHPDVQFIVNHAGMYADRNFAGYLVWRDGLRALANHENVCIKISGLGMLDHDWTIESCRPYVYELIDAFGIHRSMFASNFPVDKLFSTYAQLWRAFSDITGGFSDDEKRSLFSANAERIYRI